MMFYNVFLYGSHDVRLETFADQIPNFLFNGLILMENVL